MRFRTYIIALLIALALLALPSLLTSRSSDNPFAETTTMTLNGVPYIFYVADTPAKQRRGYMNTTSYDPRGVGAVGMVFLFGENSTWCFWMHDTYIPLRIVWVSGTRVTKSVLARPLNDTSICGYGDKVLEIDPRLPAPTIVK